MTDTKPFGIRISTTSRVSDFMYFEEPVFVKDHCYLRQSRFGAFTFVGDYNVMTRVEAGRYCSFGPGCRINPGQHPIDGLTTSALTNNNPFAWFTGEAPQQEPTYDRFVETVIGHDVWIGADAIVMGGVRIGDGAVIGAGSVVTRDIPPYVIAAGVPATLIRSRFDDDIIRRLRDLQWWRFDLALWSETGDLQRTRPIDCNLLDRLEQSIATGRAPLIAGRACKVSFEGSKATMERLDEAPQPKT